MNLFQLLDFIFQLGKNGRKARKEARNANK